MGRGLPRKPPSLHPQEAGTSSPLSPPRPLLHPVLGSQADEGLQVASRCSGSKPQESFTGQSASWDTKMLWKVDGREESEGRRRPDPVPPDPR